MVWLTIDCQEFINLKSFQERLGGGALKKQNNICRKKENQCLLPYTELHVILKR